MQSWIPGTTLHPTSVATVTCQRQDSVPGTQTRSVTYVGTRLLIWRVATTPSTVRFSTFTLGSQLLSATSTLAKTPGSLPPPPAASIGARSDGPQPVTRMVSAAEPTVVDGSGGSNPARCLWKSNGV